MKFPKINLDSCPTAAADQCGLGSDGTGGSGDQSIVLQPGFAVLCDVATMQFHTYLVSSEGEVELTSGILYSTSDASILNIDPITGSATKTGQGIVTIQVKWQDLMASAQITCGGDGDCCVDVPVQMVVLKDVSASMEQNPFPGAGNKRGAGEVIIKHAFAPTLGGILDGGKDQALRIDFSATALHQTGMTAIYSEYAAGGTAIAHGQTDIKGAFDLALTEFDAGNQQVIIIVSDGQSWPALSTSDMVGLLAEAQEFKDGGGLIVCVGISANNDGFSLLQQLSSGGFLINVLSSDLAAEANASDFLKGLLCLACAGVRPSGYGYGCDNDLPGAQQPDAGALDDVESGGGGSGGGGGGGGDLPLLPAPMFDPPTSSDIGGGIDVTMSVSGHPAALIRYSITVDGSEPPDPTIAYSGPVHVVPQATGAVVKLKAQAREGGYNDSNVVSANYTQGASTNGLPLVWQNDDMKPGTPYPSVAIMSGLTGLITSVKVRLKNINAQILQPKGVLLVGPDGTAVLLMYFDQTGDNQIIAGATLTFDDTASLLPQTPGAAFGPAVPTGSYRPTVETGGELVNFPSPAPAAPYQTALAAFNGNNPNGTWQLFIIDVNFYTLFGINRIDGGWDLQISSS